MKTSLENHVQHQDKVDRDPLFSNPEEPDTTTNERIIIGNNEYEASLLNGIDAHVVDYSSDELKERLEHQFIASRREYDAMLRVKVKNELVSQICSLDMKTESGYDLDKIAEVITTQMHFEMNQHLSSAGRIEKMIPIALSRPKDDFMSGYTQNDVTPLRVRADSHLAMYEYIRSALPEDDEIRQTIAEAFVEVLSEEAEKEATPFLIKKQIEMQYQAKINELETKIEELQERLAADAALYEAEIESRDWELREYEMAGDTIETLVADLTKRAQSVAQPSTSAPTRR